jgi:uncharacterized protein (DUF952 family)
MAKPVLGYTLVRTVIVFKLVDRASWPAAAPAASFAGSAVDARDGFIHFSTAAQLRETAARHFAGQPDLLLVAVDAASLGEALRWEPSRGGDLFPHLYGPLPSSAVRWVSALDLDDSGGHVFPDLHRP